LPLVAFTSFVLGHIQAGEVPRVQQEFFFILFEMGVRFFSLCEKTSYVPEMDMRLSGCRGKHVRRSRFLRSAESKVLQNVMECRANVDIQYKVDYRSVVRLFTGWNCGFVSVVVMVIGGI
jgi:hypothetical protein